MNTIKVRPVLLPTNYIGATLTLYHDGKGNYPQLSTDLNKLQYHTNQEIILISLDEKIEVGDTYCYFEKNTWNIRKCLKKEEQYFEKQYKLIATQEQLSPELIQQLVDEYNNGGMQDFEIEMEYYWENYHGVVTVVEKDFCYNKIRPKLTNGFVTVVEEDSDFPLILQALLDKKAESNNRIDLDVYAKGLLDCYKSITEPISYTEEEVKRLYDLAKTIIYSLSSMISSNELKNLSLEIAEFENWFNQNKKK